MLEMFGTRAFLCSGKRLAKSEIELMFDELLVHLGITCSDMSLLGWNRYESTR